MCNNKEVAQKILIAISKLNTSRKKIHNASEFIDFFVHDILDYSILNENSQNFHTHEEIFQVREAVEHIIQIMEDKAELKNISISTAFMGFNDIHSLIKTDKKRI